MRDEAAGWEKQDGVGACLGSRNDVYKAGSSLPGQKHPWGFVVNKEMGVMGWEGEGSPLGKACRGERKGGSTSLLMQEPSLHGNAPE